MGAQNAASDTENFSWRNVHLAVNGNAVAGMLLAYRLPDAEHAEDLEAFPAFIRPLIELEHCVPGSFYINMLATYPEYRNQAVGTTLMGLADGSIQIGVVVVLGVNAVLWTACHLMLKRGYRLKA